MTVVDAVQDIVDLINAEIDLDNIENTSGNLHIAPITDNVNTNNINSDYILVYEIQESKDYSSYFNRNKHHKRENLRVQITARKKDDNNGGIYPIANEMERIFEVNQNWSLVDPSSNWTFVYVQGGKDISNKRTNFFKYVIDLELLKIAKNRRTS